MSDGVRMRNYYGDIDLLVMTVADGKEGGGGAAISRGNFTAKFESSTHNRKPLKSIDDNIEKIWREKCIKNPRLFNQSKFRWGGLRQKGDYWEIQLGLSSYKDFCATNLSPDYKWIQEKGLRDYGDSQAYMSDALGKYKLINN